MFFADPVTFIAAVASSDDAIVTKTLDSNITGWNQAAERLFGYSANEAVGKQIDFIVPEEHRNEPPDRTNARTCSLDPAIYRRRS